MEPRRIWPASPSAHGGELDEGRNIAENMENMGLFPRPFSRLAGASIRAISSTRCGRSTRCVAREWACLWGHRHDAWKAPPAC